ncbi:uncharacterized protein LOC115631646 isoform X1 [Scaptodrosophila lebanonensis]|uniref:Uncharacterized protein LOC115631646 isoform X1 n=1 Tax=Drosophila lebanonensis TaxID=7225 RepID=A0A6J2UAX3_DROLE|nr:uncharacterized protein LOC115631646 isoform X1 [Scaptodrosophila lebanonensis]
MQQPTATTAPNTGGASSNEPALRACNTAGCKVEKYVEVTKRKCSQFVSAPYVMPKPLVVNGRTAIFQVGGEMAKMGDIPSLSGVSGGDGSGQPIYRIKPGTHAHIINYVLVDEGSESMEKANSGDQEALRMMLDAQRESASTKLQRLVTSHRGIATTTSNPAVPTSVPNPNTASALSADTTSPLVSAARRPAATPTTVAPNSTNTHVSTPQIHPDFSIANVEGAVPFVAAPNALPGATVNKQNKPPEVVNSPIAVNQLQAEILELRRTVARLEEGAHR